ncbi:hypothetical protein FQZ97_384430 [compost metagenome]
MEGFEVPKHGAGTERWIVPVDLISRHRTLSAGIRLDDAGVHCEPSPLTTPAIMQHRSTSLNNQRNKPLSRKRP